MKTIIISVVACLIILPALVSCSGGKHSDKDNTGNKNIEKTLDLSIIQNPVLRPEKDSISLRDPALFYHKGTIYCYYSYVYHDGTRWTGHIAETRSKDLVNWSEPRRISSPVDSSFWSPGNVIRVGDEFVICFQSYNVPPEIKCCADNTCRLYLMRSKDLENWSKPVPVKPEGATVEWTDSPRQIDAYLVKHEGRFWCFYKGGNQQQGLLVSDNLEDWEEASPERPVLSEEEAGSTTENVCVVRDSNRFVMFFVPTDHRKPLEIGKAYSNDLFHWDNIEYIRFPDRDWMPNGPNASAVIDLRDELGIWLMAFHADIPSDTKWASSIAFAWSKDLEEWIIP